MNFDASMPHKIYDGGLFKPSKLSPDTVAHTKFEFDIEALKELKKAMSISKAEVENEPAPPAPRYIVMPHGRSLVVPLVTENGFGTVEYELERRHFTYRVPLNMMWMNSASPEELKSKQVVEYMLEKAWAGGSRLSEKLHNIANVMRCIEDGMVQ